MINNLLTRIGLRKAPERAILHDASGVPHFNHALLARKTAEREQRMARMNANGNGKGITVRNIGTVLQTAHQRGGIERKDYTPAPVYNDRPGNPPSITVYDLSTTMSSGQYGIWGGGTNYYGNATQGYVSNSDVFACIDLIARAASQVKWWDGAKGTKCIAPPSLLALAVGISAKNYAASVMDGEAKLDRAADPRASVALLAKCGGGAFIAQWINFLLISGNSYIEITRKGPSSPPDFLYNDNPGLVSANIDRAALHPDTLVSSWKVRNGYGKVRQLSPWRGGSGDIVHSKLFHPTDLVYGMSPLEAARLRIGVQNKSQSLINDVMDRGAVPGWIEAKEGTEWTAEHLTALRDNIVQSRTLGRELFLEGAEWHPMGFEPVSTGMSEQQLLSKRDIAAVFHVDPALIGDTTARTYATYREARRGLYMEAVIPLLRLFRDAWNRTIGMELKSPLDFDKDSFDAISAAREEAADRVKSLFTSGIITQNESRLDLEYDAVSGGDTFYAPANMVPLAEATPQDNEAAD